MSLPFVVQQSVRRLSSTNLIMASPVATATAPSVGTGAVPTVPSFGTETHATAASSSPASSATAAEPLPLAAGEEVADYHDGARHLDAFDAPIAQHAHPTDGPGAEDDTTRNGPLPADGINAIDTAESQSQPSDGELKLWSRLRGYEAQEARCLNHQMLMASRRAHEKREKFTPDGDLLFTDEYIRRFIEEEERKHIDWMGKDSAPVKFEANVKETDADDIDRGALRCSTAENHRFHEEAEAEADEELEGSTSTSSSSSSSSSLRLGISALRNIKFPKVMSLASKKRAQERRSKGKEGSLLGARRPVAASNLPWAHDFGSRMGAADHHLPILTDLTTSLPLHPAGRPEKLPRTNSDRGLGGVGGMQLTGDFVRGTADALSADAEYAHFLSSARGEFDKSWGRNHSAYDYQSDEDELPPLEEPRP